MRTMRQIATPVFWVVAITFIGWLAYGQVSEILGGGRDVVLRVNGTDVRLQQYNAALQAEYEDMRRQQGSQLTREDEQQAQNQVVNELTQEILVEQQCRKLGITVTDQEIIQAAQSAPPPDVMRTSEFQTNGQFDITKWQRFLASGTDPQFLQGLEARYRQRIPQVKLGEYLTSDIYIPDAKLWRVYRDQHESVTLAVLALRPEEIADQDAPVSDAELQQYYDGHKADFKRPAVAYTSFIVQPRFPDAADTVAALDRARRLRAEIMGGAKFEDVAKRESADSATGPKGGDLGWMKRDEAKFDPQFALALRQLRPGGLSQPVLTSFGYHLIWIASAKGDSIFVRHILIPVEPQGKHLDYVEARADTLDKLAGERTDGASLDTAAHKLNLPLRHADPLLEGDRMSLGMYLIPDVSVWAFEAHAGETSPVIEARPGYYVFRLDSLIPAGTPPLTEIRAQVLDAARLAKKKDLAGRRAAQFASELGTRGPLAQAAAAHGMKVETVGPFTRIAPPPILQGSPAVIGAAFGLAPGTRSGMIKAATGYFVIESLKRTVADSAAWLKQRDAQRDALMQPVRQGRVQAYIAAVRERAKIVDRRKDLFGKQASGET